MGTRQRRIDTDLVQDNTEKQHLKELELISQVRDTLVETLGNARDQLAASREAKHRLEMDWSDKVGHLLWIMQPMDSPLFKRDVFKLFM